MVVDEAVAALAGIAGVPLQVIFVGGYLLSMALIWLALWLIGARVFQTPWATVALAAAFTLRHRIPRTSANSFEPVLQPADARVLHSGSSPSPRSFTGERGWRS